VTESGLRAPEPRSSDGATLSLSWPAGRRLLWCMAWLALLVALAEVLARTAVVRAHLPAPSFGVANRQFELQWARLEAFVAEEGQPNCIFIGSSQVLRGIDPLVFEAAYRQKTGQDLRCFTFGVRGFDPDNSYEAARLVLQEYHPRLLIFGTDIPSYSTERADAVRGALGSHAWVRYRLGEPVVEGWLIDHSAALRAYLPLRFWFRASFDEQQAEAERFDTQITREGFGRLDHNSPVIGEPPQPGDSQEALFDILRDYTISGDQLASLENILALRSRQQVVIVEMPLHPTFFYFFGNGRADYDRGLQVVRAKIRPTQVEFIETTDLHLIADSGWANRNHLNTQGASVFSQWLGARMAELALSGRLPSIAEHGTP